MAILNFVPLESVEVVPNSIELLGKSIQILGGFAVPPLLLQKLLDARFCFLGTYAAPDSKDIGKHIAPPRYRHFHDPTHRLFGSTFVEFAVFFEYGWQSP